MVSFDQLRQRIERVEVEVGQQRRPCGVPATGCQRAASDMISWCRNASISASTRPSLIGSGMGQHLVIPYQPRAPGLGKLREERDHLRTVEIDPQHRHHGLLRIGQTRRGSLPDTSRMTFGRSFRARAALVSN
jgi:hypothetical protein